MDKVWIVTKGEYSDYRIVRMFSDKGAAERYAKTFSRTQYGEDASVEEWDVDRDFDPQRIYWRVVTYSGGHVYAGRDGTGISAHRQEDLPEDVVLNLVADDNARHQWTRMRPGYQQWSVWVQAEEEAKALKIGSDLFAQYKAEKAGIA